MVKIVPRLEDLLLVLGNPIGGIGVFLEDRVDRILGLFHKFRKFNLKWFVHVLGVIDPEDVNPLTNLGNSKLVGAKNSWFIL